MHNWFASRLTHLPTDRDLTIGFSINRGNRDGDRINLNNWVGLLPVMTYGDPEQYDNYEWFAKDAQGNWVSDDPFKTGDARLAGNGNVPQHTGIQDALARQFLSADGRYWQPWKEVDATEVKPDLDIFRIKQRFARSTASIAMRIPFSAAYYQELLARLKTANLPGVTVDDLGLSNDDRPLAAIRIEDPASVTHLTIQQQNQGRRRMPIFTFQVSATEPTAPKRGVIVLYAREHATESDGSWVVLGALKHLLAQPNSELRRYTWIIIPLFDADAASRAIHSGQALQAFDYHAVDYDMRAERNPYVRYAAYLRAFANAGCPILLAMAIHNCECREYPVALSPFYFERVSNPVHWKNYGSWYPMEEQPDNAEDNTSFNTIFFDKVRASSLPVGSNTPLEGNVESLFRLNGACYRLFATLPLIFEINSRYPDRRLTIKETEDIGGQLVDAVNEYFTSENGKKRLAACQQFLAKRDQAMQQYWAKQTHPVTEPTTQELLQSGL